MVSFAVCGKSVPIGSVTDDHYLVITRDASSGLSGEVHHQVHVTVVVDVLEVPPVGGYRTLDGVKCVGPAEAG